MLEKMLANRTADERLEELSKDELRAVSGGGCSATRSDSALAINEKIIISGTDDANCS